MAQRSVDPVTIRRDVLAPLTPVERIAFEAIKQIINEGRQVRKAEICAAVGSENWDGGTASGIIGRLEAKGYISRRKFQRGMIVCIGDTCSAPPNDQSPHWRDRERAVPVPAIQAIRQREPELAVLIEKAARAEGKFLNDFLADCTFNGFRLYQDMKDEGL
jgi:hypothetical protein